MRSYSRITPYSPQHGIKRVFSVTHQTSNDGTRTEQKFTPRVNTLEISRCAFSINLIVISDQTAFLAINQTVKFIGKCGLFFNKKINVLL